MYTIKLIFTMLLAAALCACASSPPERSLYDRIGGLPVLKVVVNETIDQMVHDPRTSRSFQHIKLPALKESIVNQLCVLTGGSCIYEGETMKNSHKDAKITEAEFDLMVAALRDSLSRHTGTREKNELLRILAPMKRDIVAPAEG